MQFADQSIVIGAGLLVDLDPFALDGDPVAARLGKLLHHRLDGRHLLWLDQCGTVFDQGEGDHAVDTFTDREAGWKLRNRFAMTLARATKVIARLAGFALTPIQRIRYAFAIGVADRNLDSPGSPSTLQVIHHAEPFLSARHSARCRADHYAIV